MGKQSMAGTLAGGSSGGGAKGHPKGPALPSCLLCLPLAETPVHSPLEWVRGCTVSFQGTWSIRAFGSGPSWSACKSGGTSMAPYQAYTRGELPKESERIKQTYCAVQSCSQPDTRGGASLSSALFLVCSAPSLP